MSKFTAHIDIFLQPGDFYFGDKDTRISTLLGSCVAITIWHPYKKIGGMCHYMLPTNERANANNTLSGKYADDVIQMFLKEVKREGTRPADYQAKIFGAGHMFAEISNRPECIPSVERCLNSGICNKVSCRNALAAPKLLKQHGFNIVNFDLGGTQHRKVIFEVWSGDVWMKKGS